MGYGSESRNGMMNPEAALLVPVALQTPADKGAVSVLGHVTVLRVAVLVTTAVTVAAAVVAFDKRVTFASDTGRVELARITVPIGTAIGQSVYKDVSFDLNPGEQIVVELITASTAGGGLFSLEWIPRSATSANAIKSV